MFCDRYGPVELPNEIGFNFFHKELASKLSVISQSDTRPHLIFTGLSGAGKTSLIKHFLTESYGNDILMNSSLDNRIHGEISLRSSSCHIELYASDLTRTNDAKFIQTAVKDFSQLTKMKYTNTGKEFKTIIIYEADLLSLNAQAGLRRTMEKYSNNCRFIFTCENIHKIIDPIRSRLLSINVPRPSMSELVEFLKFVANAEYIYKSDLVNDSIINRIAMESRCDITDALAKLEYIKHRNTANGPLYTPEWIDIVFDIKKAIISEQTPKQLMNIRSLFYELYSIGINGTEVLRLLLQMLLSDANFVKRIKSKSELLDGASLFDSNLARGGKEVFHLEAFAAHAMALLAS